MLHSENKNFCSHVIPRIILQKYMLLGRSDCISTSGSQTSASSVAVLKVLLKVQGILLVFPGNINTQIPACSWTQVTVSG